MKHLRIIPVLLLAAALSSCDLLGQGTPQPSLASLQATAMAQAQAEIAQTAAASPTDVPAPTDLPTPTLMLTNTPVIPLTPIPTSAAAAPVTDDGAATASSTKTDYCNTTSISKVRGPHVQVTMKILKQVNGLVNLYFYMTETAFGCGYGNVQLNGGDSVRLSLPQGCYAFYGWISGPANSVTQGNGLCFYTYDAQPDQVQVTSKNVYEVTP